MRWMGETVGDTISGREMSGSACVCIACNMQSGSLLIRKALTCALPEDNSPVPLEAKKVKR